MLFKQWRFLALFSKRRLDLKGDESGMIDQIIKQLRIANEYTQKQIAEILNIDRSTYAYYESGKTKPDIAQLAKLARLYNVSVDSLIGVVKKVSTISDSVELKKFHDENRIEKMALLSDDEKSLVLLFRSCADKNKVLDFVRDFAFLEDQKDTDGE